MGRDKAFMPVEGQPMIQRLATLAAQVAAEVLVSASTPALYSFLGFPVVPDIYPGLGPMAGIHAAMSHSRRDLTLVLACDLPRLHVGLLQLILSRADGYDAVVPKTPDGKLHPVCACYRRTLLPELERRLKANRPRMLDLFSTPGTRVFKLTAGFNELDLVNWNTPNDLLA
jgi:molybdenum cofactor guanylyltransferase